MQMKPYLTRGALFIHIISLFVSIYLQYKKIDVNIQLILGETDDEWIDWDVSINGHTHGGQIHLPFIGPVASPNYGLFPGKINVTGIHEKNGHIQYVGYGLGVSGPKIFRFRFLNPPAIGLITLSRGQ